MAKSGIPGIYGFARGKVGAVVYSTSNAALNGGRKQIVRIKAESVKNPRTIAQIVQRMKIGPAQLFYAAFEKAAGSVENNPLSHSWEGVEYGSKSRMRFMQLAMAGEPKAYVPKGVKFPAPGQYQVSEGSLQSLPWRKAAGQELIPLLVPTVGSSTPMDNQMIQRIGEFGVEVGDQISVLALVESNGQYNAFICRIIVGVGNTWENLFGADGLVDITTEGYKSLDSTVAAFAVIVSRGTSNDAKRSTETMLVTPAYASLLSPEAYDKAVESYVTGVTYNSLNSTWYLNQGSTQAFNGEVFFQSLILPAIEGVPEETVIALLGRQVDGGSVRYVVFTSDGTSAGTIYGRRPGGISTADSWTASRAVQALGNVNVVYAKYTEAIGAQAMGNA